MRISAYARATNPKYANFFNWQGLAGQLGTKAGNALSTTRGAVKLGAGIGAGIGAINYLGSEDKSIGNLVGQVAGGAALGGAAGYGGASLKNAYQARKAGNAPKQQAQLPAAQPVQRPQPTQNGVIITPAPTSQQIIDTTAITVPNASGKTQSGASAPQNPVNTKISGAAESERQKMNGIDKSERPNASVAIQDASGNIRGAQSQSKRKRRSSSQANLLSEKGVTSPNQLSNEDYERYINMSKNSSPFANFKVRRYNGFVY
ncbi:hypothetical protein [Pseudanabaena phage PA-SR01]|nr:hypothetical protein [Pseudanabaena phage PA-SR01]